MTPPTDRVWSLFERVVGADTAPDPGDHRIASDHPRIVAFMEAVARPELRKLGAHVSSDAAGNLIATFGDRTGDELLLVAYPACHHANRMLEPLRARTAAVDGQTYWYGQGASEGKAPFVALIEALTRCREGDVDLAGRVMAAVSTEGSSTNESSTVMFDELGRPPAAVALMVGTQNQIALGHRGRADVIVTTSGTAMHSSVAAGSPNAIAAICEAERRVQRFADRWTDDGQAGASRSIVPYRLVCGPVAPHTMPERCELALDCRLLPGDDVDRLRLEIERAIDRSDVTVALGPTMLPAMTDPDSELVRDFVRATRAAGLSGATFVPPWTYDAGAAARRGLPVVLFGPSSDNTGAIDDADGVEAEQIELATEALAGLIAGWRVAHPS